MSVFVAGLDAAGEPVRDRVPAFDRPPRALALAVAVALNAGVMALVLAYRAVPRPPDAAPRALEIGLVAPVPLPAVPAPEPVRPPEVVPPEPKPKPAPRPPERVVRPQPAPPVARPAPETPPLPLIAAPEAAPAPREAAPTPVPPSAPVQATPAPPVPVAAAPSAPPSPPPAAAPAPAPVPVVAPRFDAAYLSNPAPAYPSLARRMGEQGRVILRVVVTADGRAERVEVRTSSGSERLDRAALEAVTRWRFVPARRGEEAVSASVLVPINFSLDG